MCVFISASMFGGMRGAPSFSQSDLIIFEFEALKFRIDEKRV